MKKFFEFLKKNKALEAYLSYADDIKFSEVDPVEYISFAFPWYETKEGSTYWINLNHKWINELKNSSNF